MPRPPLLPLLAGIAFVASQANLASILLPLQPSVFALQLAFAARKFWHVVKLWGTAGMAIYRSHFVFDNLHPFIYGVAIQVCRLMATIRCGQGAKRRE